MPRAPALDTARGEFGAADPLHATCTIGCLMPNISVKRVLIIWTFPLGKFPKALPNPDAGCQPTDRTADTCRTADQVRSMKEIVSSRLGARLRNSSEKEPTMSM